jgi:uncharacterized protein (TIGR04255 family)
MDLEPVTSPFALEPLQEIPLARTPLVAVLFQARFPMQLSKLLHALKAGELQDVLADDYPFANEQDSFNFLIQPGQAPVPQQGPPTWVFQDASEVWTCNISADSVALTSARYTSRRDFVARAERLLAAIEKVATPPKINRLGIRYLNRVESPDTPTLNWTRTLTTGARGILSVVDPMDRPNIVTSLSQVQYKWPDSGAQLQGRWGLLPPGAVIDAAVPPTSQESWVLDVDCFTEGEAAFEASELATRMDDLAGRAYRFFRWVMAPASLARFDPKLEAE